MASSKEIKNQINSIRNTGKITAAMEMVAASKMKKSQARMRASRPYDEKISKIVARLTCAHSEYQHPYTVSREEKVVGFIIVASDRGLCGGLNNNLFRKLLKDFKKLQDNGKKIVVCTIGKKANNFFKSIGISIAATTVDLGDNPRYDELTGSIKIMLDKYDNNEIDSLRLAFNIFANTMTQKPTINTILPIQFTDLPEFSHHWDYIYEPDSETVLNALITRYIESSIYQAVVENIACEQSARMVAMKSATDNASDMLDELSLVYNKARQATITQEISEIVGGASAV